MKKLLPLNLGLTAETMSIPAKLFNGKDQQVVGCVPRRQSLLSTLALLTVRDVASRTTGRSN